MQYQVGDLFLRKEDNILGTIIAVECYPLTAREPSKKTNFYKIKWLNEPKPHNTSQYSWEWTFLERDLNSWHGKEDSEYVYFPVNKDD